MKKNSLLLLSLFVAVLSITACGGGSSSAPDSIGGNPSEPVVTEIEGGTVDSPAQMDHSLPHTISSDDAKNYFRVDVQAGQRIVIYSALETYLEDRSFARCSASPGFYYEGVRLVGTDVSACAHNFEHTFGFSGEAKFRFGYPYENSGVFFYSIVGDANDAGVLEANGEGGLPDGPRRISVVGDNAISSNHLRNYFVYEGVSGETITLNAYLDGSVGGHDPARCSAALGAESLESHYTYGFAVNNRQYNCDDELSYTFTESGVVNIHIKYIRNISGYFVFSSDR